MKRTNLAEAVRLDQMVTGFDNVLSGIEENGVTMLCVGKPAVEIRRDRARDIVIALRDDALADLCNLGIDVDSKW